MHTALRKLSMATKRHKKNLWISDFFSFSLSVAWLPYKSILRLRMLGAQENSPQIPVQFSCHCSVGATERILYTQKNYIWKKGTHRFWYNTNIEMGGLLGCDTVIYGRIQTFRRNTFPQSWAFKLQQTADKTVFGYNVKKSGSVSWNQPSLLSNWYRGTFPWR